ncbi:DnaD domain protein [Paenibacillus sp. MBLB4367]|uniref:DnaD domain protein n=1 Tax=Paenibacillus sp. MBLB4367 TaxID=3384767 RepID=UPI0039083A27
MSKKDEGKLLEAGMLAAFREGNAAVPLLLLKYYARLKLSDSEAMLLIHLLAFVDKEKKDFPTIEEIQSRMASDPDHVIRLLQKLMKEGWINIDEHSDPVTRIRYERYNLTGVYAKLAACGAEELMREREQDKFALLQQNNDLFTVFEKEFARPLTPMELETIANWLDKDGYREELIVAALKEAVFAGKVHFRYVDRILLEWSRNRVTTTEQAKEHAQRFRSRS